MAQATVVRQEEAPGRGREVRSSKWAWWSIVLNLPGLLLGLAVMVGLAALFGVDLWEPEANTTLENLGVGIPALLVWIAAPALGLVVAVRAALSGNRAGTIAIVPTLALLVGNLVFSINAIT